MVGATLKNRPTVRAIVKPRAARSRALWIGFTGLLLLMAVMALDLAISLRTIGVTSAAVRRESRDRDSLLDQLRSDIYHSGTVVRDYLLEVDDRRAASQKRELEILHSRIDDTLRSYEVRLPVTEKQAFSDLRSHVESYWESLKPVLAWNASLRRARGWPI